MDLVHQALWTAFEHSRSVEFLAVPVIARDPERHWILAQNVRQLLHQAAKHGPDELVKRLWKRLEGLHRELLKECILHGNLAMIEFIQKNVPMPMNASVGRWSTRNTLQEAIHSGHLEVVRFFLKHKWSSFDLQFAVESSLDVDIVRLILEHSIAVGTRIFVGNALYGLVHKNQTLFEILLDQTFVKPNANLLRQIGVQGDRRALTILFRKYPTLPFDDLLTILIQACEQGHARMVHTILKKCRTDQPHKSMDDYTDCNSYGNLQRPRVSNAYRCGFLRLAKVLLRHGFPDSLGLYGADEGYFQIVAYCLKRKTSHHDLLVAMKRCARGSCLEYQVKGIPTSHLWHQSPQIHQGKTMQLLMDQWLFLKKPFDLFEIVSIAMTENNFIVAPMILPYVTDLRRNSQVLGALAKSMTDESTWTLLREMAGEMTAENYEDHMMRNSRDDDSIATSDIEVRQLSDSD